jgi:hypothetical protein
MVGGLPTSGAYSRRAPDPVQAARAFRAGTWRGPVRLRSGLFRYGHCPIVNRRVDAVMPAAIKLQERLPCRIRVFVHDERHLSRRGSFAAISLNIRTVARLAAGQVNKVATGQGPA